MDAARTWIPRGLACLAFCVYAVFAPAGWYWLDSAELSAAAINLGSPHPTGFPMFCVLGKAAQFIPVGEMAYRIELLSAASAALAVLWVTRLTFELAREDVAGLVGAVTAGATLAVSLVFARQATVAEVYAPNAAFLAGALLLFTRVARGGGAREGLSLAVVCGLGLGVHVGFLLIGPPVAALLLVRLYRGARWPLSAPLITVLVAGALYTYLPVRSATGRIADVDWGHPRTAGAFVDHISASGVREAYADEMRSTSSEVLSQEISGFAEELADSVGLMPLAALFGMIWLFRQRRLRWPAAALTILIVGDAGYSVWINPMGAPDLQNTVPLCLGLCVAGGVGVAWLARYLGRPGPFVGAVVGLVVVIIPALLSASAITAATTGDLPRALVDAGLEATPPRGVVLVQSDSLAAGMIYATAVEGARPDVAVVVRQQLVNAERTRAMLAHTGADVSTYDHDGERDPLGWIMRNAGAITWEMGLDTPPRGTELVAGVPLARLVRSEAERDEALAAMRSTENRSDILTAVATLERIFDHPANGDRIARRTRAITLSYLGNLALGRRDIEVADLLFTAATEIRPEHVVAWVNRGVIASMRGDFPHALEYTERALHLDGNRVPALINATRYAFQMRDFERAETYIERALRLEHERADVWALAAVVDVQAGRRERALERLSRARAIDPEHPDVKNLDRQLNR